MGWSRRATLALALTTVAGCERPHAPAPPDDDGGFPTPEQTATLFDDGRRHQLSIGDWVTSTTRPAGTLHLPTGRLIAADPSWLPSAERLRLGPYTVTAPPGSYPVTLALVSAPGYRLVAAARLTVRAEPVRRWDMALLPGQDPARLAPGEAYNVGVDTATMAFLDASVLTAMGHRVETEPEAFVLEAPDQPLEVRGLGTGGNLIAFGTGHGDGGYPVWIGRTAKGAVGCFMADMAMLPRKR